MLTNDKPKPQPPRREQPPSKPPPPRREEPRPVPSPGWKEGPTPNQAPPAPERGGGTPIEP
jgi:hypothetical protein